MSNLRPGPNPWLVTVATTAALLTGAQLLLAGGPLIVDSATGTPYTWQVPHAGPPNAFYNIEAGPFNAFVDNATAHSMIAQAFMEWQNVPSSSITYSDAGPLRDCSASVSPCAPGTPLDISASNLLNVFGLEDGQSPIIFDADGSIFSLLGFPPGVLAFASPEIGTDGTPYAITEGIAVFNGAALQDINLIQAVMVHEFGHFSNLAHSAVNGQAIFFNDHSGPSPYDPFGFGPPPLDSIETMYPFLGLETSVAAQTLHADDIASISAVYPSGVPLPPAAITGRILRSDGATGITGVNVIARNINNPFHDAVSALSGDFTQGLGPLGTDDGLYTLRGLAGGSYAVYIDEIQEGGFSTPPAVGFVEECYNGFDESSDPDLDDPSACSTVTTLLTAEGVDVVLQSLPPDPNEPNEDSVSATNVTCGLLLDDVTIDPLGDLDFYAIDLVAGEELIVDIDAVVLGSPLDSLIGIFAPDGVTLLVANDDEVPFVVDSLLIFTAPTAGRYYVAVTAWDDFDFDGTSDTGADVLTTGSYNVRFQCNRPPVPFDFEVGRLRVSDQWQQVTLTREFWDPIVIAGPAALSSTEEALVRVRNVTPTGFEIRLQEWDFLDGDHPPETVSYIVVERGRFVLPNGSTVEAGSLATDNTGVATFQSVAFSPGFPSNPVVLATIGTDNDSNAVTTRLRAVSNSQFEVTMQEEEGADQIHGAETIYYLAWQVGTGQSTGILAGAPGVDTLDYDTSTATVSHDFTRLPRSSLEAQVQEERSGDAEVFHADEFVGYVILGRYGQTPFLLAHMQTTVGPDPSTVRWRKIGLPVQTGNVIVNDTWKTVPVTGGFANPVVVAQTPSYYGSNSGVIRIRNVTPSSFDIRFQEWLYLDGVHFNEEVTYLVVEAGMWELPDGSELQAGYVYTDQTGVGEFLDVPLLESLLTEPVVLSSLNSFNGGQTVTTRLRNVGLSGFELTMHEEEGNDQIHISEVISFIAWPPGSGFLGSFPYEVTSISAADAFVPLPGTLFEIKIDEEQSVDVETSHSEESVGVVLLDDNLMAGMQTANDPDPANLRWRALLPGLETGLVRVDHNWRTVVLNEQYDDPVVVARPASHYGTDPGVIRIRNVTANSFDIRFQEWLYQDGAHYALEEVAFLVMEAGRHFLPTGEQLEAGYVDSSNTGTNAFLGISYLSAFPSRPVVVSSLMTFDGGQTTTTRLRNVTNVGFQLTMQEEEGNDQIHAIERLGYIAWPPGAGALGSTTFEANTSFSAGGDFNHLDYSQPFGSAPCLLADMQTTNGPDPANLRLRNRTSFGVELLVDEESSLDAETGHLFETIAYLALDCAPVEATAITLAPDLLQVSAPSPVRERWTEEQWTDARFRDVPLRSDPLSDFLRGDDADGADQCEVAELIFPWSPGGLQPSGDRLSLTALVINPHPMAVQMEVKGLSHTGSEVLFESRHVGPRQVYTWTSQELSSADLATLVVTSDRPLDGFSLVGTQAGASSGISARSTGAAELTFPLAGTGNLEDTVLFLFNPSSAPVETRVDLVDEYGEITALTTEVLSPRGSFSKSVTELFEGISNVPQAYLRVNGSGPLHGAQLDGGSRLLAAPAQRLEPQGFGFAAPARTDDDTRTVLHLINAGPTPTRVHLERWGGRPLDQVNLNPGEAIGIAIPTPWQASSSRMSGYIRGDVDTAPGTASQVLAQLALYSGERLVGRLPVQSPPGELLVVPLPWSENPLDGNQVELPGDGSGLSVLQADLFEGYGKGVGRVALPASRFGQLFGISPSTELQGTSGFLRVSGQGSPLSGGRLYWNGGVIPMAPSAMTCRQE